MDVTSNSSNNAHISYDCELNFSAINEPSTFEEAISCNGWKDAM